MKKFSIGFDDKHLFFHVNVDKDDNLSFNLRFYLENEEHDELNYDSFKKGIDHLTSLLELKPERIITPNICFHLNDLIYNNDIIICSLTEDEFQKIIVCARNVLIIEQAKYKDNYKDGVYELSF